MTGFYAIGIPKKKRKFRTTDTEVRQEVVFEEGDDNSKKEEQKDHAKFPGKGYVIGTFEDNRRKRVA